MKKIFYIIIISFFIIGCANPLYPDYILTKKYPLNIPDLELKFQTDTTGIVIKKEDKSINQNFNFIKKMKNFLIITYIDNTQNLVFMKSNDTIVYYKKELYIINEKHKLFFKAN